MIAVPDADILRRMPARLDHFTASAVSALCTAPTNSYRVAGSGPIIKCSHEQERILGKSSGYTLSGATASPAQVVNYRAAEVRGYDIRSNTCKGVCGHYTQVIWGKTRAVGCAVATDRRREVWVCNYDPPGNVIGYRPY